jgi:signal transduction histidine kinase
VERTLHQAADQAVAAYQELAATVHGDLAMLLARRGPAVALADLASSAGASAQIDGGLDAALTGRAGVGVAQVAWFVAAEGLTNALRHAGAARLRLTAGCDGDRVVVEVIDDGIGGADPAGRGLSGLRLRAAEVGGHLTVSPGPDGGTVVRAELPFSRPGSTGSP